MVSFLSSLIAFLLKIPPPLHHFGSCRRRILETHAANPSTIDPAEGLLLFNEASSEVLAELEKEAYQAFIRSTVLPLPPSFFLSFLSSFFPSVIFHFVPAPISLSSPLPVSDPPLLPPLPLSQEFAIIVRNSGL